MPNERKLRELAAIAQLYNAMSAPQMEQQQQRQRAAMALLGFVQQMQDAQTRNAYQQQQLGVEEKKLGILEQGQRAEVERADAAITQRDKETRATIMSQYAGLLPQQQQAIAPMLGQLYPWFNQASEGVKQQQIVGDMPAATEAAKRVFATKLGNQGAAYTTEGAQHPALDYVDYTNPELYPQAPPGAANAATQYPGLAGSLGSGIRTTPVAALRGLQNLDTRMTNAGSNFWAGLLGLQPQKEQKEGPPKAWPWSK